MAPPATHVTAHESSRPLLAAIAAWMASGKGTSARFTRQRCRTALCRCWTCKTECVPIAHVPSRTRCPDVRLSPRQQDGLSPAPNSTQYHPSKCRIRRRASACVIPAVAAAHFPRGTPFAAAHPRQLPIRTVSSPVRGVVPEWSSSLSNPDYCRGQSNSCYITTVLHYLQEI